MNHWKPLESPRIKQESAAGPAQPVQNIPTEVLQMKPYS